MLGWLKWRCWGVIVVVGIVEYVWIIVDLIWGWVFVKSVNYLVNFIGFVGLVGYYWVLFVWWLFWLGFVLIFLGLWLNYLGY